MSEQSNRHRDARAVVEALSENDTPMWRDNMAERTGLSVEAVGRVLDLLSPALVKRVTPRRNDEWALTLTGHYAAWLMNDNPPPNPG